MGVIGPGPAFTSASVSPPSPMVRSTSKVAATVLSHVFARAVIACHLVPSGALRRGAPHAALRTGT